MPENSNQDKSKKGNILSQIIPALVVALIAGGTSPWWYAEFIKKQPTDNFSKATKEIAATPNSSTGKKKTAATPNSLTASPPAALKEITWNESASSLIANIDQDFAFTCPSNGTIGNVWGTDIYTSGSSICSAAVHAGIINTRDGGEVQIRIRPGEEFYNGTTRNGLPSKRYGKYRGSFTFLNAENSPIATKQIQIIEWNETASRFNGKLDQDFTFICPSDGTISRVWGTDIYTSGSSICSAAVHAGIINTRDGGEVQIRIRPGAEFYNGTTRNGFTSNRFGSYPWSFQFLK